MAYITGAVRHDMLVDTLVEKLTIPPTGAIEPYWKKVQSGAPDVEGYILYSKGKSGTDNIYFRIKPDSYGMKVSVLEKYTPNAVAGLEGTIENETVFQLFRTMRYNNTHAANREIDYILNFDRDKIIIVTKSNKLYTEITEGIINVLWAGMPERLSNEKDSTAVSIGISQHAQELIGTSGSGSGLYQRVATLRDRSLYKNVLGNFKWISSYRSKGWGNKFFLQDFYIDYGTDEGLRSKLTGLHPVFIDAKNQDFKNFDEITVGTRRFIIIKAWDNNGNYNYGSFTEWVAIEKLL